MAAEDLFILRIGNRSTILSSKRFASRKSAALGIVKSAVADLSNAASEVSRSIELIDNGLKEQSAASSEIAQRVEQIARGTEETQAASAAAKSQSGALSETSHLMKATINKFRLV